MPRILKPLWIIMLEEQYSLKLTFQSSAAMFWKIKQTKESHLLLSAKKFYGFFCGVSKEYILATVTFVNEVSQRLANVMRKVFINSEFNLIVDKILQNFAGQTGAQMKKFSRIADLLNAILL